MAGLGFKDFAVGEVLTSADVDGYLMQQTVMRFADSGARGSALGTATGTAVPLAEGMVSYLDDADTLQIYTGAGWDSVPPAGAVMYLAGTAVPSGWLKANGAAVSRTTYSGLFVAIGTAFGSGDGSTTFTLPDLRGEFLRGWDDGRGVDSGRVFGSAQGDAVKNHVHNYTIQDAGTGNGVPLSATFGAGTSRTGTTANNTDGATENRPRNVSLLACIKF